MRTIGAYQAKTHLLRLLDDVARGETITITQHGVPVAKLVPPESESRRDLATVLAGMDALRHEIGPLGELTVHEMIEEGRRF